MTRSSGSGRSVRRILARAALAFLLALGLLAGATFAWYRRDLRAAEERIAGGHRLANTPCGTIEYGEQGRGRPVLVLHGAGGGYDQGLLVAYALREDFRVIAPSRFGYLGTPIPATGSLAAQAKGYACLLDALKIDRVAVVAGSAGGPSALQFALRYPERVDALVLVSAISTLRPIREETGGPSAAQLSDFAYWLAVTLQPNAVLKVLGIPGASLRHLSKTEYDRMLVALRTMQPMSRRLPGMNHDAIEQGKPEAAALPIEKITAPTLVVHATDDALIPFAQGRHSADHIPGARLLSVEHGGHFAFVLDAPAAEIRAFLVTPS